MTSTLRLQGSRIIADWPSIPFSGTTVERIEIRPPPFGQEIIRQKMIGNSLDMDQYVFQPAAGAWIFGMLRKSKIGVRFLITRSGRIQFAHRI
jgi:hypothetical protein